MAIEKTGGSYPQKDNGKLALANRRWRAGNLSAVIQIPLAIKSPVFSIVIGTAHDAECALLNIKMKGDRNV